MDGTKAKKIRIARPGFWLPALLWLPARDSRGRGSAHGPGGCEDAARSPGVGAGRSVRIASARSAGAVPLGLSGRWRGSRSGAPRRSGLRPSARRSWPAFRLAGGVAAQAAAPPPGIRAHCRRWTATVRSVPIPRPLAEGPPQGAPRPTTGRLRAASSPPRRLDLPPGTWLALGTCRQGRRRSAGRRKNPPRPDPLLTSQSR